MIEVPSFSYLEEVEGVFFKVNINSKVKILIKVSNKFIMLPEVECRIKIINIMDIDLEPIYNIKSNLL